MQAPAEPPFWAHKPLHRLTRTEWEALCDGCARCCLIKLEDEETGEMKWTMRSPDVTEFTSILNRHGAWNNELVGLVEVAQRLNIEARVQEVADSVVQQNGT